MRLVWTAAALMPALLLAAPIAAKQTKPITDSNPDAMDIAKTPVTDLNLDKTKIPPILQTAIRKPYDLTGVKTCSQISAVVLQLDEVLGPDIDLPETERDGINGNRLAKWAVGSFIPFRGLIREISGANAQERAVLAAARAGIARRSFLKGMGQVKGCKYPASPATPAIIQAHAAALKAEQDKEAKGDAKAGDGKGNGAGSVPSTSEPVVQKVP